MRPFKQHRGICAPILVDNVDTDQIIPSREMTRVSKLGLGAGLFAGWRYLYEGEEKAGKNPDFVLNQPQYDGASVLYGGRNFGCGSSREHAVWALKDYGIKAIIAESFGRIFRSNCARNGLLAIVLPAATIEALRKQTDSDPQARLITIDLTTRQLQAPDGDVVEFDIDEAVRNMLLQGLDPIDYSLQFQNHIRRFVAQDRTQRPWAHL